MKKLSGYLSVGAVVLLSAGASLAQDAGGDMAVAPAADIAMSLYASLAGLVAALLGWIGVHIGSFIRAKVKNETIAGVAARFNDSLFTALKAVNQTLKAEILAAKDPKSPGGTMITKLEAEQLKTAVIDMLKREYGGTPGLMTALRVFGFAGEGPMLDWLGRKIEAGVHDLNKAGASPK
jgi:hypothetical protein